MRVYSNASLLDGYVLSSGTAVSKAFRIENCVGYSVSITGSANSSISATAVLQGSNDWGIVGTDDLTGAGVVNWTTLPNSGATASQAVNGAGTILFNVDGSYYRWTRVLLTWTSGSCTVAVRATGKGV